jgi:hypothetical protein
MTLPTPRSASSLRGFARPAAAAVAAVCLLAVASAPTFASAGAATVRHRQRASTLTWTVSKSLKRSNPGFPGFSAVTATGPGSAWAFLDVKPVAWRLASGRWSSVRFPAAVISYAAASDPRNVWAFGTAMPAGSDVAYRFDGVRWAVAHTFPVDDYLLSATVISPSDVYVFTQSPTGSPTWRYNGRHWRQVPAAKGLRAASALSAGNIWAVSGRSVAHFTGGNWHFTPVRSLLPEKYRSCADLSAVYAQSARNVWAIDSSGCQNEVGPVLLLHYTGRHWRAIPTGIANDYAASLIPDGNGGLWLAVAPAVISSSYLLHFADGKFTIIKQPVAGAYFGVDALAHAPGSTVSYAAGFVSPELTSTTDRAIILRNGP